MLHGADDARTCIIDILAAGQPAMRDVRRPWLSQHSYSASFNLDPRSIYRRERCVGELYPFCLDVLHVVSAFGAEGVTVQRIRRWRDVPEAIPRALRDLGSSEAKGLGSSEASDG